jgi:hypothetical protein
MHDGLPAAALTPKPLTAGGEDELPAVAQVDDVPGVVVAFDVTFERAAVGIPGAWRGWPVRS